jgi:hypothetical protein
MPKHLSSTSSAKDKISANTIYQAVVATLFLVSMVVSFVITVTHWGWK